ncbi:MAG: hypothetical protein ABIN91_24170 [Mucilaginibacter sp.]|uniref:hypothetical protein n=1 Tax=Mucilaginibacter sp. TaxID=1882438 RepID=UPI003265D7C5
MNKQLSLLTGILLFTGIAFAQDTAKKAAKAPINTAKPTYKPAPYGYRAAATQTPAQPAVIDNSLNGQYTAIYKMAEHWQQAALVTLHKSYTDTINADKRKLKEANAKLTEQAKTIADLQGTTSTKDQSLTDLQKKVNSISFLGIPMTKSAYNILMWGLVLVLGGSLAAVIFLSASNKNEAAYRIQLHSELTEEYAAYKAKANEKEKKLARELQTERNKLDELTGR